jgi:hypothetical protein
MLGKNALQTPLTRLAEAFLLKEKFHGQFKKAAAFEDEQA